MVNTTIETRDKTEMVIGDTEIGTEMVHTCHHTVVILGMVV